RADYLQVAYQRVGLSHQRHGDLRRSSGAKLEVHLTTVFNVSAKVGITGRPGNCRHIIGEEPSKPVYEVDARRQRSTAAGVFLLQVPSRNVKEAQVFENTVSGSKRFTYGAVIHQLLRRSHFRVKAMGHSDI